MNRSTISRLKGVVTACREPSDQIVHAASSSRALELTGGSDDDRRTKAAAIGARLSPISKYEPPSPSSKLAAFPPQ